MKIGSAPREIAPAARRHRRERQQRYNLGANQDHVTFGMLLVILESSRSHSLHRAVSINSCFGSCLLLTKIEDTIETRTRSPPAIDHHLGLFVELAFRLMKSPVADIVDRRTRPFVHVGQKITPFEHRYREERCRS